MIQDQDICTNKLIRGSRLSF